MEGGTEQDLMCWVVYTVQLDLSFRGATLTRGKALVSGLSRSQPVFHRQQWEE